MNRQGAFLAFAMVLPSAMAYGYFVALGSKHPAQTNTALLIAYPIAKITQALLPLFAVLLFGKLNHANNESYQKSLRLGSAFGIVAAVLMFAVAQLLQDTVLVDVPERVRQKIAEFGAATPLRFMGLAAFLSVAHSLFEEYYWRWFVHVRLRQWLAFTPAALFSGVTFAAHHFFVLNFYMPDRFWSGTIPFTMGIAVGGMFWAWLYEHTGSLFGPWISHVIVDLAIMTIGYNYAFCR